MSKLADDLAPRISRQVVKLRERTLLDGAMATSALVAMADRRLMLEESLALGAVLENVELLHGVNQSLRAHHLFKRDVDYLIKDGKVVIVDDSRQVI